MKTRADALALLHEWVKNENLRKHMYCVEAVMRACAEKYGGEPELWGMAGLVHDLDYERYPYFDAEKKTGHPFEGLKALREKDYPPEILEAIDGHAQYSCVPRASLMAKCLFAVDELSGFLVACAYLRPDHFAALTSKSVLKKLKDKSFAAKVSREDIDLGIAELGADKAEFIDFVIVSLRPIQPQIFS
ncbi:MAG: HDIG domain-containing protein [Patescibacteria group bacterium]|nr:HDIG domain-containing protein [Patescibacteria group bacterium]